ncbi:MAG: single-stranded DNA-binding protein [Myxococcota bacterium]
MRGINKVILLGHVGRAPESRTTQDGRVVTTFSLATRKVYLNRSGEKHDETEWHRIVTFGKLAEVCSQYLEKGRPLYVEGRLQTRSWEDREGITRFTTEVVADTIQLLRAGNASQVAQSSTPILKEQSDMPVDWAA